MASQYVYDSTLNDGKGGWYAEDFSGPAEVTIKSGMGILVNVVGDATITFSGAVSTDSQSFTTVSGFNFFGNNTPHEINIQDIKLENGTDLGDNIQILDEGGAMASQYVYDSSLNNGNGGWYAEDFSGPATTTLLPGQGILLNTVSPAIVTLPGAKIQ